MNAYRVDYKLKDAGYKPDDEVSSGGSFDTHHDMLVYATNKDRARDVVYEYHDGSPHKVIIKTVRIVGVIS